MRIIFSIGLKLWLSYALFSFLHTLFKKRYDAKRLSALHTKNANQLFQVCTKLKGTIIKVAQLLATRPDFIPQEYCDILANLHDRLPPMTYQKVKSVFIEEFEKEAHDIFDQFDEVPFASASLGQVHKAEVAGKRFAVKVQYPSIDKIVKSDMKNLDLAIKIFGRRIYTSYSVAHSIYNEIKNHIFNEIDYYKEAENIELFAKMFQDREDIKIPGVYKEYSRLKVLCMEWMPGDKITRVLDNEDSEEKRENIIYKLVDCFTEQVLHHGIFQADAHPGNILVTENGDIVILDFGLVKCLSNKLREGFILLGAAIVNHDEEQMEKSFRKLGFRTESDDLSLFKYFGNIYLSIFTGMPMDEVKVQFDRFNAILRREKIASIPHDFILLMRVFMALNGLQSIYSPKGNFGDIITKHKRSMDMDIKKHAHALKDKIVTLLDISDMIHENMQTTNRSLEKIYNLLYDKEKKKKRFKIFVAISGLIVILIYLWRFQGY